MELRSDIEALLQRLRGRLETLYGDRLVQLILYGSHARDEATDASDVDVMVVLTGEIHPYREIRRMSEVVYDLELETETAISLLPVSLSHYKISRFPVFVNARREGMVI